MISASACGVFTMSSLALAFFSSYVRFLFCGVFLFLLPELNARLRTALSDAPLLRAVVSHGFEIYGWKCGERMRVDDELFLKWEAPFAEQAQHSSLLPASIVEHAQDCGVEEEVRRSRSSTE